MNSAERHKEKWLARPKGEPPARDDFPEDYFIEELRGMRRLNQVRIRSIFARRSIWLSKKIAQFYWQEPKPNFYALLLEELAAIAQVLEVYDKRIVADGIKSTCVAK